MATPEAASLPITVTGAFILTPAALAKLNQDGSSISPEQRVVVLGKIIGELQKRIVRGVYVATGGIVGAARH
ncbi:hypothetical protein H1R20_g14128, partial [Candolleomyces eurysporus]